MIGMINKIKTIINVFMDFFQHDSQFKFIL